jgi:hypothetical protein
VPLLASGVPGTSLSIVVRGLEGLSSRPSERQVRLIRAASVWPSASEKPWKAQGAAASLSLSPR